MQNCPLCDTRVISGHVLDSKCLEKLKQAVQERDTYRKALETIRRYGDYAGYLAGKALAGEPIE